MILVREPEVALSDSECRECACQKDEMFKLAVAKMIQSHPWDAASRGTSVTTHRGPSLTDTQLLTRAPQLG